jgi:hypothetical protein
MRPLSLFLFLLLRIAALTAQNEVLVNVTLSPPYSHRLSDYTQYRAQQFLTLTNLTQQDQRMKIIGEIRGLGTGLFIKTRLDYVPNQVIVLGPGESRSFAGQEITGYFDRNNTEQNIPGDLEADIIRTGLLPQDNYDYCIEVVDINTLKVLGRKCTLIPIQYLSPPQPNLPWCGESHNVQTNPIINFSWLPPTGGGMGNANIQYDFYLIPVPDGQNPAQLLQLAMDGQLPGFYFVKENLPTAAYFYNTLQDPPLEAGNYVWGIVATDINHNVGIENQGRSAFCTLTIKTTLTIAPMDGNGGDFPWTCSCKSPAQKPGGSNSPQLLQPGVTVMVGQYSMRVETTDGAGNGTGKILVPGFPGGIELPIWVDFTGLQINANREMIKGVVHAQVQEDVSFLPNIDNPQLQTLPLDAGQIDQLDQYFEQNLEQLLSKISNPQDLIGFRLPLGLDKNIGGQQFVVAITGLHFDATQAALDAAIVLDLVDAGTKIALSGRGICLKNGVGLCAEGELYLAENLNLPPLNMYLRGLSGANDPKRATRVVFDKDGFKKLYVEAVYTFPANMLSKVQGGGQVEASLSAETDRGWSDWVATINIDPFRIMGVNDFAFNATIAYYDHSSITNPNGMPGDYPEGQPLTWNGFFLKSLSVDLPPIIKRKNSNLPLTGAATNVIIDGNGVTGALSLNNLLAIGEGGDGHWQFSVDQFVVKFLKNTFQSGGFNGKLLLPITSRNEQAQLLYSSLLSYANQQFEYQFNVAPKNDLEVDLFAAYFNLNKNSNIMVSYSGAKGFEAHALLSGEFRIGGKFDSQLPRIDIAHVSFQNLGLTTTYPYFTPGQVQAALGSPQKSVGGFPLSVKNWELFTIGLQADVDLQLSDLAGFLPNASATIKFHGKFNNDGSPAFERFEMSRIHVDADFSVLHVKGDLEFFSKDATWGDGFQGKVEAVFPLGFTVSSRLQIGAKDNTNYWYVDGQTSQKSGFTAGLSAYGFSGGACYNMKTVNFTEKADISSTEDPEQSNWLGAAPSKLVYQIQPGNTEIMASVVVGLDAKELFNAGVKMHIKFSNGGLGEITIKGKGGMFADPGRNGLANGDIFIKYNVPQKIVEIGVGLNINLAGVFTGKGYLSTYSNGTTGDWNFKLGRPFGWGPPGGPCSFQMKFPPLPLKIEAGGYFQCGNFEVDGLPKRLPNLMQELFPDYPKGYYRVVTGDGLSTGSAIACGAYLQATLTLKYLIFYAEFSAVFGFDLQLSKATEGCDKYPTPGMNGWYGNGQLYAGIKAAIGIEVDLFFISGRFEILSISFGGLLSGGGPNPTWVIGTVGGRFSILGGMVEGYCSFRFEAGDKCIPNGDPLANLKLINETFPAQSNELQPINIDPAVSVNLPLDFEFFLEEIKEVDGAPVTVPRLFKCNRGDVEIKLLNTKTGKPAYGREDFDPEGFGKALILDHLLELNTNYVYTVSATVQECGNINKAALSTDGQHGIPLSFGSCNGSWNKAIVKKTNKPFLDERKVTFKTNGGLMRLDPNDVVYSLPHHNQRYFCYQDIAKQTILGLRKRVLASDIMGNQADQEAKKTLKVRLIKHGQEANSYQQFSVPVDISSYSGDPTSDGKYWADGANHFWSSDMWAHLSPSTTFGVQFFIEWETPPAPAGQQGNNYLATTISRRALTSEAYANERKINLQRYNLKKNQREVYRYYFRTSQYTAIEQKLAALDRNQLVFTQFQSNHGAPKPFSIVGSNLDSWENVIARLKANFTPEELNPPKNKSTGAYQWGIYLSKAGFLGPERFDVFDIEGYQRTIQYGSYSTSYKVKPLLEFDRGEMKKYWQNFFNSALDTLLQNGILGNVDYQDANEQQFGWVANDFTMRVNNVMGPIDTSNVMGGGNGSYQSLNINFNSASMAGSFVKTKSNSMILNINEPAKPNLLEIRRTYSKLDKEPPGTIFPGNHWLNTVIKNWNNIPGPAVQNQFYGNIGAAFDLINNAPGPAFNPQWQGQTGSVKVNIPKLDGGPAQFQLGKK